MFKMPNITTAAAVFVTKELQQGERIAYSCWAALWETWLHPFSHYTHDLKNVCLTFKHSPFHVSSSQNEPYKKITFLPPLCFTKKEVPEMFFLKDVFSLCLTHMQNHLFSYMKRKMWPGKENHSHKNSLSFTHGNKKSPITFFFITTWFHTFCSQVINTGEKNYLGQT